MTIELTVLGWGAILGLIHIFAAGHFKTQQYGAQWNVGARDENLPAPLPVVGRMIRAQANYFETFPILAVAIILLAITGISTRWTEIGALLWLGCRVLYLPLYAFGILYVRSLVFLGSTAGLLLCLWPSLF
jgi:uncharacterized MAPEG superfamily protein